MKDITQVGSFLLALFSLLILIYGRRQYRSYKFCFVMLATLVSEVILFYVLIFIDQSIMNIGIGTDISSTFRFVEQAILSTAVVILVFVRNRKS